MCTDLTDSTQVAKLLRGKIAAARERGGADQQAVLCVSTTMNPGLPVVALVTHKTQRAEGTVSFEITAERISAIFICILGVYQPARLDNDGSYHWPHKPTLQLDGH